MTKHAVTLRVINSVVKLITATKIQTFQSLWKIESILVQIDFISLRVKNVDNFFLNFN